MVDYRTFESEDFLFEESFRQWTRGTSSQATAFWENWLAQNPDRMDVVRQAQELVLALDQHYHDDATDERMQDELDRLIGRAARRREETTDVPGADVPGADVPGADAPRVVWGSSGRWRWLAAASVALLLGLMGWLYRSQSSALPSNPYEQLTQKSAERLLEKRNNSPQPIPVVLGDGSIVTLAPNSRLSYPRAFGARTRTVYLSGEAFFDVVRKPAQPFLIYANQTITKVLGTSFLVRAYQTEKQVTVAVRTGRVSVYAQAEYEKAQQTGVRQIPGVVLTPNQQMTYNLDDNRLVKALVDKPEVLLPAQVNSEQTFDDAPVTQVLGALSRKYGIKLVFDENVLAACSVTLSFTDESMLERLEVICQTIGATYEVVDGQVVVHSKGC